MARVVLSKTFSIDEIDSLALELLRLSDTKIWCFDGDLGAGKTTLIRAMVPLLAPVSPMDISSPTFTYLHEYETVCHFDLYRLSASREFEKMGFEECFSKNCFIEWANKIEPLLPDDRVEIFLKTACETTRKIEMKIHGSKKVKIS